MSRSAPSSQWGLGSKSNFAGSPTTRTNLVALHPPLGYFVEGKIRQKQEKLANSASRFSDLGVDLRNALADPAHIGNQVLGVGAPPLERADRLGGLRSDGP